MSNRLTVLKTVLWTIVGMWAVITVARFTHGLGATTNLHDAAPWGLWIGFDVMAGVALAAGAFVLAASVYIFHLEKYRSFVRPAILTAFLGYTAVAVGLLYDLGLPWNIWHPMIYWQHQSVLFEVAMCVIIYLTVLALEFAPVVLEHPLFDRALFRAILAFLKKITLLLVIGCTRCGTARSSTCCSSSPPWGWASWWSRPSRCSPATSWGTAYGRTCCRGWAGPRRSCWGSTWSCAWATWPCAASSGRRWTDRGSACCSWPSWASAPSSR
jgi:Ni/Fe-hydrogenase subunit HybB-like protein